ncbi:MAG: hypothetical protein AAGU27_08730 [Dehalobacterium sp.]
MGSKQIIEKEKGLWVHIPAYPDGESGGIRTLFRKYPDSDSGNIRTLVD